ncbi:glycosyltransferase [Propionimicrobium sp. PCR01-08-3]|uniref:glycosyltransferase n=1 Tax=Propionimicrobium sp. PCR01-08-3 TaxID=3052086 RepID=UPI00255C8429|nr:glycosyltransferase [Propionimicrobium sp. PCR01-08-3]WIY83564.1 glycosyltransferase [Propionimicrobium sp. PCR01-08-3]
MHIAFFSDQHPATLGGLQVSVGLQREFLEAAGHTVTICSPDSKRRPSPEYARESDVSLKATQVGEHSFRLAGRLADRAVDAGFMRREAVDIVHIQADVWGAWNGYRFARRHGLPVVHTMHTNIEIGLPAVVPLPRAAFRLMYAAQQRYMHTSVHSMAGYVQAFAEAADTLIVPSSHFAERLRRYGVDRELHVIPTGVDDQLVDATLARPRVPRNRPRFLWAGRISEEKRLDDVIRAFAASGIDADLQVYGSGPELNHCKTLSEHLGVAHLVTFRGAVSHDAILGAMRQADMVIQSSLGYETQGLTVYEAVSVGTPVLVRDPDIADDLPRAWCHQVDDASVEALTTAIRRVPQVFRAQTLTSRRPPETRFRQSRLTAQIIDVYETTLARHGRWLAHDDRRLRVA